MTASISRSLLILMVCLAPSHALSQNLLVNGSFEAPNAGSSFTSRSGDFGPGNGWAISGAIDHIGGFWAAAAGTQSVDLNSASAATVSQTFATSPGHMYLLKFAISENFYGYADKTMNVLWNGSLIDSVTIVHDATRTPSNMMWSYRSRRILANSASVTLAFQSTTGAMAGSQGFTTFYGPAIDDVSVVLNDTCAGDFNGDQLVNDDDFVVFASAYNILDCQDPSMPADCPADLNGDGLVDDGDFSIFVQAYDELVCP